MATQTSDRWQHSHQFHTSNLGAERKTRLAVWLTAVMMVAEVAGGWYFNSMALLADGWHMSSTPGTWPVLAGLRCRSALCR
jgi:Co/Zn/Cd efflux system component